MNTVGPINIENSSLGKQVRKPKKIDNLNQPQYVSIIKWPKGYVHLGSYLAPFGAKNCFSPISCDWFIRRITEV